MSEILNIIKNRRSVRKFENEEIPKQTIERLKEALIWAPSAGNLQSRKFYFVFNQKIKEKLINAAMNQDFIAEAPLVIVACADEQIERRYGKHGKEIHMICDVAVSVQNLMLLAYSEELGSVWIGAFDENQVKEILDLSVNLKPIAIIPVGYPAETPLPPQRISKDDAVVELN